MEKVDYKQSEKGSSTVHNERRRTYKKITSVIKGSCNLRLRAVYYQDFVTNDVIYDSSDLDVVVAYEGRILARGVGEAVVTIKVGDLEEQINVIVENEIPQELVAQVMEITTSNARSTESEARNAIVQKGADMVYCMWKPTRDLVGWRSGYIFKADKYQYGIPYSQAYNGMCDNTEFLAAMSKSDFYTTSYEGNIAMPRYGNDCSAFVAICWGLTYNGDYRYNTTKFNDNYASIGSYANLQRGDAVVSTSKAHIFLVIQNWEVPPTGSSITTSYVTCYEQTPYNAQLTFWTYNQLSNNSYKAISKF